MNYTELIDTLKIIRNKSDIEDHISKDQLKLLSEYSSELSSDKDLADQLMTLIRFSNVPLKMHFFDEKQGKERKLIEKKLWNDFSSKEICDLSSIIWSISKGSLSQSILIKSDESKTIAVKRFSFLLAVVAQINNTSITVIYESVVKYKEELYQFYKDETNILVSFLSKNSRFIIEKYFILVGTLWFGGDNFEYLSEEYIKNFSITDELYNEVVKNLIAEKIITKNENEILKLNKNRINNVRLSLIILLSHWTFLYGKKLELDHVLPQVIYSDYLLFGKNYNMKQIKKTKSTESKKRRPSYKIIPKVYEYTYIFWSNIFDEIYRHPLLQLKNKYEDVRLFLFRYSLSPLLEDIIAQDDTLPYRELIRLLEELNIIKIISIQEKELVFMSKNILGWLFENKKDSK